MASLAPGIAAPARSNQAALRVGWGVSGLVGALLFLDGMMKIAAPRLMIANSPPLGLPADIGFYQALGAVLVAATLLYLARRTAFIGAILLTGYLGGAIAIHARVGSPPLSHTLFGLYLGVAVWGGLWLRDRRVRALLGTN
jgi:hypothetical protein